MSCNPLQPRPWLQPAVVPGSFYGHRAERDDGLRPLLLRAPSPLSHDALAAPPRRGPTTRPHLFAESPPSPPNVPMAPIGVAQSPLPTPPLASRSNGRARDGNAAPDAYTTVRRAQRRRANHEFLGIHLQRTSWTPAMVALAMLLSKVPVLYGVSYWTLGAHTDNAVQRDCGAAATILACIISWGALGFALRDALALSHGPTLPGSYDRNTSLQDVRSLAPLAALGFANPLLLALGEHLFARGRLTGDLTMVRASVLPLCAGAGGWISTCGSLFAYMQLRRGWVPLMSQPKSFEYLADICVPMVIVFGLTNAHTHFSATAQQLNIVLPYLGAIAGYSLIKSLATYTALQNRMHREDLSAWQRLD